MPAQIRGRTQAGAKPIEIRDHARKNNGDNRAPLRARKKSALHGERSQAVSKRVHGESVRGVGRPFRAGDEEAQRLRHDAEFHRQARQWFAIDLRVSWVTVNRFAYQTIRLPKKDALFLAQVTEPERGKVAQILQATLRGEAEQFELVLE